MKQNYTDIVVVLDRSGSMQSIQSDTIGGFNRFLEDQKKTPGEAKITLAQFDDQYDVVLGAVPIASARPLDDKTYQPRGSTCLYGAIGRTIEDAGARFNSMPEHERPEKVVCLIITDGQENHSHISEWSRQWTQDRIKALIQQQSDTYKWQFVFIGANQDAILTAQGIGINVNNALNYTSNAAGTEKLYKSMSANLSSLRCCATSDMSWSVKDREEQEQAK